MLSTTLLLAASMVVGHVGQSSPLPEDVTAWMQYEIGTWKAKAKIGEKVMEGEWSARWVPGKFCELIAMSYAPSLLRKI